MTSPTVPIPQPPPKPVAGNLPDIASSKGVLGIVELAERYGSIVRIQFFNRSVVAASSQQLVSRSARRVRSSTGRLPGGYRRLGGCRRLDG